MDDRCTVWRDDAQCQLAMGHPLPHTFGSDAGAAEMYPGQYKPGCTLCAGMGCATCYVPPGAAVDGTAGGRERELESALQSIATVTTPPDEDGMAATLDRVHDIAQAALAARPVPPEGEPDDKAWYRLAKGAILASVWNEGFHGLTDEAAGRIADAVLSSLAASSPRPPASDVPAGAGEPPTVEKLACALYDSQREVGDPVWQELAPSARDFWIARIRWARSQPVAPASEATPAEPEATK